MGRLRIVTLTAPQDTERLGESFAALLSPNTVLALRGNLGAGKTSFVKGLAKGLDISTPIQSPTFTYLHSYFGILPLHHFDLYRLKTNTDFQALGFDEFLDQGAVCAIEWPELAQECLPQDTIHIHFEYASQGRIATFSSYFDTPLLNFEDAWD